MIAKKKTFPALSAGICLAGLLFCLWVLFSGGEALCLTNGCTLFQDLQIAGVSLWHLGAVLFALLLLCCLARLMPAARLLALAAVLADTVLLGIMLFTAPCVNCLLVGLLIALACLSLHRSTPRRPALLWLWLLLFLFSLGSVVHDLAEPWSPQAEGSASVHIYFSPSCQACRTLTAQAERLNQARWYPVPENRRDIWVIRTMLEKMNGGMPLAQAAAEALAAVPEGPAFDEAREYRLGLLRPELLLLQFRLWKNQAHVLASGSKRLPFLEFAGLPVALLPREEHVSQALPKEHERTALPSGLDLDVAGFCGGEEPCADPAPARPQGGLHELLDESGLYRP